MISIHNLYAGDSPVQESEIFTPLHQNGTVRIESIRSWLTAPGGVYDQNEDEWVVLLEGEAELEIGGVSYRLERGDSLFLPRHTPHRVLFASKGALWLGVFSS